MNSLKYSTHWGNISNSSTELVKQFYFIGFEIYLFQACLIQKNGFKEVYQVQINWKGKLKCTVNKWDLPWNQHFYYFIRKKQLLGRDEFENQK